MSIYNDTLDYLEFKGILTQFPNLNLYLHQEPGTDGAEQQLTLIPTQGFPNDPGDGGVEYPGFQLLVRDKNPEIAIDILAWVKKILTNTTTQELNLEFQQYKTWDELPSVWDSWEQWSNVITRLFGWENTGSPGIIGRDEKQRTRLSDNYIIYANEEE